jgi:hypothetical protein
MMRTKTVYLSREEINWIEEHFPEASAWGFNINEYLEAQALAYELNDQYESDEFEDNLYVDISNAFDQGYDKVKFEWDGGNYD